MTTYWIGGSVCSGKSVVAEVLSRDWGATIYEYDKTERNHLERLDKADLILDRIPDPEERRHAHDTRWLHRPPADMATRTIRSWAERFPLVLEDLGELAADRVVAQGPGLFPHLVAPLLEDRSHGVWLIATGDFIQWARRRRGMTAPDMTSDPQWASENIVARDRLMADHVRADAEALGLRTITVDGSESVDALATKVATLFGWTKSG